MPAARQRYMLKELNIKNFAIIDQLHVEFTPGLNVFTGETGAGKSIVVDALNLALGERASMDLIRTGCQEAIVEAAFDLSGDETPAVFSLLAEQGIDARPAEDLIIRRVISSSGKNKVYINGSLANLSTLAAIGAHLADIHGQHEHQSLLSYEHQMGLLDTFGDAAALRKAVAADYYRLQELRNELGVLESGERDRMQREDLLHYQKNEIEAAHLTADEDVVLAQEQKLLTNAEKLAFLSREADAVLYAADGSVLSGLKKALVNLKDIVAIDPRLTAASQMCEAGTVQIEEAAREIASYAEDVEFDPKRLEEIGDRLDLIQRLKKKYGGTIHQIIEFGESISRELDQLERRGEEIERIQQEIAAIKSRLTEKVTALTARRRDSAQALKEKVEAELAHLGMKKARFTVTLSQTTGDDTDNGLKVGPRGADRVEFLISPNPGEAPKPLAKIASGGELSRIMLALKTILAEGDTIPTLVFDEVDAGIGGAIAEEIGKKLRQIAERRQVFCITHLPQIASAAMHHYGVVKSVQENRTRTEVCSLVHEDRVNEIARMLGGKTITDATMRHAEEMIARGNA